MTTRHTTKRHEPKTHPDLRCYERFKTLVPAIALRPRRSGACPAPWSTLDIMAGMADLGYRIEDLDLHDRGSPQGDRWVRLFRQDWRQGALAWGVTPGLLLWQRSQHGTRLASLNLTLQLNARPSGRW